MNHLKTILKWAFPSIKLGYNLLAGCAEVFCRHSFGPRYAPFLLASFFFTLVIMTLVRIGNQKGASPIMDVYVLTFFILLVYHLGRMWRPYGNIHSYSTGRSWAFWSRFDASPTVVQMIFEPATHVLGGLLMFPICEFLSAWLIAAGFCLFVKQFLSNWNYRNRVLDAVDARLEGESIGTGVREHTAPQSGGEQRVSPVVVAQQARQPASSMGRIFSRLDPALQRLVATPNQNRPSPPAGNRPANQSGPRRYHAGPLGTLPRITSKRPRSAR